mmetsp:Transcript_27602/g.35519  ORF Transcript_27602/g.35519 Transcript_27602/m.35519 type:complete len:92 (-) Transcript_27602:276-551(-)
MLPLAAHNTKSANANGSFNQGPILNFAYNNIKLHQDWLTSALQLARRQRNPELFEKKQTSNLSTSDENNEVNSFVGWSWCQNTSLIGPKMQ